MPVAQESEPGIRCLSSVTVAIWVLVAASAIHLAALITAFCDNGIAAHTLSKKKKVWVSRFTVVREAMESLHSLPNLHLGCSLTLCNTLALTSIPSYLYFSSATLYSKRVAHSITALLHLFCRISLRTLRLTTGMSSTITLQVSPQFHARKVCV